MPDDYQIRPLTDSDEAILWEMLREGLQPAAGQHAPPPDITGRPELTQYVERWGRAGDRGLVAHDGAEVIGAVWSRAPAMGATPELAFAVNRAHRNRGVGAALLTRWVRANPQQGEISLRVRPNNPAVRLYERFGFRVVSESESSVTMRRDLDQPREKES